VTGGRPAWRLPRPELARQRLPLVELPAGTPVVRLHTIGRDPAYFGRNGRGRFDAPDHTYGVCYLGLDDAAAFVETLLRDQDLRGISRADLKRRGLADGKLIRSIRLVEFGGPGLRQLRAVGGTVHATYRVTQTWGQAFWAHPDQPDGIRYRSRFDDDQHCVALFDRAATALQLTPGVPLPSAPHRLGPLLDHYDLALLA
jgi:hypothetical protein